MTDAYTALIHSDRVSAKTRKALLERAEPDQPDYAPQTMDAVALVTLRAVLARVLPQDRIDLGQRIDSALAAGDSDGWRFAALPADIEAFRGSAGRPGRLRGQITRRAGRRPGRHRRRRAGRAVAALVRGSARPGHDDLRLAPQYLRPNGLQRHRLWRRRPPAARVFTPLRPANASRGSRSRNELGHNAALCDLRGRGRRRGRHRGRRGTAARQTGAGRVARRGARGRPQLGSGRFPRRRGGRRQDLLARRAAERRRHAGSLRRQQ